jgi:hydroxylamine reductase
MFCHQCQETMREDAALFVDRMLFATITNANFSGKDFERWIGEGLKIRDNLRNAYTTAGDSASGPLPGAAVWKAADVEAIRSAARADLGGWAETKNEDVRALQSLVLYGLKGMAAYVEHAHNLGKSSKDIFAFMFKALSALTDESLGADALTALVLETGKFGVDAMALLDGANTGTYGSPRITKVKTGVRNRPGILISGHDLRDLHDLLDQTNGTGVDVYTHGEMLPAHYYPFFEKYDNLYGNYGGAWWSQAAEIESFGGPVLFTSNCLVPPRDSYKNRVFTTGVVGFEGCAHIPDRQGAKMKDFSAVIAMAKTCPPPKELGNPRGYAGEIVGGFAHDQIFALADKVVGAVRSGAIKRFVVMAGCDGRQGARSYYTDVANELPKDAVILTAGCAKYRYNKLALGDIDLSGRSRGEGIDEPAITGGDIGGIPRVLDAGQCNDSYSLAVIALKLKEIFGLEDINKLPISFDIAWYEQKAVLVLLALLYIGVKNIRLGPTLPGFLLPVAAMMQGA